MFVDPKEVGNVLLEWIIYTNTSMSKISKETGLSRTTLSSLVRHQLERAPHARTVKVLADYFGAEDIDDFLDGPPPKVIAPEGDGPWRVQLRLGADDTGVMTFTRTVKEKEQVRAILRDLYAT